MGKDKKSEMPKQGKWFELAPEFIHRCCFCGSAHKWEWQIFIEPVSVALQKDDNLWKTKLFVRVKEVGTMPCGGKKKPKKGKK